MSEQLHSQAAETDRWLGAWADTGHGIDLADLAMIGSPGRRGAVTAVPDDGGPTEDRASSQDPQLRERLRRLHAQLMEVVLNGEELDEVTRIAATAAGGPVAIVIPDFASAVAPAATLTDGDLVDLKRWVGDRGRPTAARTDVAAEAPVTYRGEFVGLVALLHSTVPAHRDAPWVLDLVSSVVVCALALDEARLEVETRLRGSFMEQLGAGDQLSRPEIVRRGRRMGCDLADGAVVLCIEVGARLPHLVAATVAEEYPGAFAEPAAALGDGGAPQVWAVLPAPGGPESAAFTEAAAKRLATRLRQFGIVGVSSFHADPGELGRGIEEAQLMLEVLRRTAAPTGDEIVDGTYKLLFRLLASHPEELTSYCAGTIGPLLAHDEQYRTDLVRTLEVYLETNCNMNTTAELIFAHRHTVAHRLERINELTGLDATLHEDRERLGLGLKVYRLTA